MNEDQINNNEWNPDNESEQSGKQNPLNKDISLFKSPSKFIKPSIASSEPDNEGNEEPPKVYPTRHAVQYKHSQNTNKKKESSPGSVSGDETATQSNTSPRSRKKKNFKTPDFGKLKECNLLEEFDLENKNDGSKWKKEKEIVSDSASDTQTSDPFKHREPGKRRHKQCTLDKLAIEDLAKDDKESACTSDSASDTQTSDFCKSREQSRRGRMQRPSETKLTVEDFATKEDKESAYTSDSASDTQTTDLCKHQEPTKCGHIQCPSETKLNVEDLTTKENKELACTSDSASDTQSSVLCKSRGPRRRGRIRHTSETKLNVDDLTLEKEDKELSSKEKGEKEECPSDSASDTLTSVHGKRTGRRRHGCMQLTSETKLNLDDLNVGKEEPLSKEKEDKEDCTSDSASDTPAFVHGKRKGRRRRGRIRHTSETKLNVDDLTIEKEDKESLSKEKEDKEECTSDSASDTPTFVHGKRKGRRRRGRMQRTSENKLNVGDSALAKEDKESLSKEKEDKEECSSDSASDTPTSVHGKRKGPRKRGRMRYTSETKIIIEDYDVIQEELKDACSVPGCNSEGHLSGKFDKHYTKHTCPIYHNTTPSACEDLYRLRVQRQNERKENAEKSALNKFGLRKVGPTSEQKEQYRLIQEERRKSVILKPKQNGTSENREFRSMSDKSREPFLNNLAPLFDIELFKEAQARAAEKAEEMSQNNRISKIRTLEMGRFEMGVWYTAPYPEEYQTIPKLYVCEFCLKYMGSATVLRRHSAKCIWRYPPGDEIYRRGNISFFEVDGQKTKTYCQNLCLLAKLFLDHKTLYFDVEPFLFYIMTEADNEGAHIIGYFSKEKNSFLNYNVSCILTLPPYQRQGYGRMLIDFSYLLSKVEGKVGSPEKPLSDLGLISYRSYWKSILLEYLSRYEGKGISIKEISRETAITAYDIVSTLQALGLLKYWKGKHIVLKKEEIIDDYMAKAKKRKPDKIIDKNCLYWAPHKYNSNTTEQ